MLEKVLTAVMGAFVGSLVGRLVLDPGWIGHLLFLTAGAILFLAVDRWRHTRALVHHRKG